MRKIRLTSSKEMALVDDEDYAAVSQWKWSIARRAARRGVVLANGTQKTIYMHREIMQAPDDLEVDHIDSNPLNNQKSNLRLCSRWEQMKNLPKHVDNTSGYKGVDWFKSRHKWRARIMSNRKCYGLGYFDNIEDAARAYNAAAIKYHGKFASLNEVAI